MPANTANTGEYQGMQADTGENRKGPPADPPLRILRDGP